MRFDLTSATMLAACYFFLELHSYKFDGLLLDASGKPLVINGVWSLSPGNVSSNNSDAAAAPAAQVYFTAGPSQGQEDCLAT
jgi:hypothetical protein